MSPANTDPIWARSGDVSNNGSTGMNQLITLAANDYNGANANNSLVWTADAVNGGKLKRLRFKAGGTNVTTVARIFINNGASPLVATNNLFYGEQSLPSTVASATSATDDIDYSLGEDLVLPAGFRVYVGLATAVAAGWVVTPVGYKY